VIAQGIRPQGPQGTANRVPSPGKNPPDDHGDKVPVAFGPKENGELREKCLERLRQSCETLGIQGVLSPLCVVARRGQDLFCMFSMADARVLGSDMMWAGAQSSRQSVLAVRFALGWHVFRSEIPIWGAQGRSSDGRFPLTAEAAHGKKSERLG